MILDQTYKNLNCISNSAIKFFLKNGPKLYYDKFVDPMRMAEAEMSTESTDIGDLVDCYITQPEAFNEFYYVSGDVKCSADAKAVMVEGKRLIMCDETLSPEAKQNISRNIHLAAGYLVAAARKHVKLDGSGIGYRDNYGEAALLKYFVENGKSFYEDLDVAGNRKIIDMTLDTTARNTVKMLQEDSITGPMVVESNTTHIKIHRQLMVTAIINGVECKILLDLLKEDMQNKILYPRDVKTSTSHVQFRISYSQFVYPNQGAFYSGVLRASERFKGYTVAPFEFIVGCTDSGEDPMVYRMPPTELAMYTYGGVLKNGLVIKGYRAVMEEIKWHTDNYLWRYPKEYYEKGYITIQSHAAGAVDVTGFTDDTDYF